MPALGEAFASPFPQPPVCQEGSHRGSLNICPKEPEMPERANGGCTGWGAAGCQPEGCFPPSHHSCAPAKPPRPLASRDSCQLRPRASPSGRWSPPHFAEGREQTTLHPKDQLSNTPSKGSSHLQVPHGAPGCKPSRQSLVTFWGDRALVGPLTPPLNALPQSEAEIPAAPSVGGSPRAGLCS